MNIYTDIEVFSRINHSANNYKKKEYLKIIAKVTIAAVVKATHKSVTYSARIKRKKNHLPRR